MRPERTAGTPTTRVLIADDHELFRFGLTTILDSVPDLEVVGEAATGEEAVALATELAGCGWMQLPHHGSRNNMTAKLVEHFAPRTAYVSAPGNDDHHHRAVVDAFKEAGARVYSTHYPRDGHLFFRRGDVPDLPGLNGAATPLWDAD